MAFVGLFDFFCMFLPFCHYIGVLGSVSSSTLIEEQVQAEEAPEQSAKPPPTAPATGQKTKRTRTTSATSKAGYQLTDIEHKYFESQIELNSKLQRALPSVERALTAWERFLVAKEEKLQLEIKLLKRQTEKDGQ